MSAKLGNYQAADILGKSGPELVVKVYDGAINSLRRAAEQYRKNDSRRGFEALEKTRNFLVHLYTTLDEKRGGEIAEKLSKLYAYLIERIDFVQATKDVSIIDDMVDILNNVRGGWVELAEKVREDKIKSREELAGIRRAEEVSFSA